LKLVTYEDIAINLYPQTIASYTRSTRRECSTSDVLGIYGTHKLDAGRHDVGSMRNSIVLTAF